MKAQGDSSKLKKITTGSKLWYVKDKSSIFGALYSTTSHSRYEILIGINRASTYDICLKFILIVKYSVIMDPFPGAESTLKVIGSPFSRSVALVRKK